MRGNTLPEPTPRTLECPRCEVPLTLSTLKTAVERWEVEVDVCSHSCGGVWLDRQDFQVDPKASLLMNQALLAYNVPALKGFAPEGQADCPVCRVPMVPYNWKQTPVPLDRCVKCRGLWFDGREISAIQRELKQREAHQHQAATPAPTHSPSEEHAPSSSKLFWAVVVLTLLAMAFLGLKSVLAMAAGPASAPMASHRLTAR